MMIGVIWIVGLISVLQIKSICSNEIIDITSNFYSNQSVNIKFAFKATINQSLLTKSFKSELTFSNEANYFIILSNVTHFDYSTKPDCYPIFMGYAYPYNLDGDIGIKPPYMKYSFKEDQGKFYDIIPFRKKGEKFYLKYFQNKKCTRTSSILDIFGILAYTTIEDFCPKQNQWKFILKDPDGINLTMCINKYRSITIDLKSKLESFGAIVLNNTDKSITEEYSTSLTTSTSSPISSSSNENDLKLIIILGVILFLLFVLMLLIWKKYWERFFTCFGTQNRPGEPNTSLDSKSLQRETPDGAEEVKSFLHENPHNKEHVDTIDPNKTLIHLENKVRADDVEGSDEKELQNQLEKRDIAGELIPIKSNEKDSVSNSRSDAYPRPPRSKTIVLIPEKDPVSEFDPEGKAVNGCENLGPVVKMNSIRGGYFLPAEEYAHNVDKEWRQIKYGNKSFLIWSRPYLIKFKKEMKMILQFTLTGFSTEQFIIKMKLLPNNYINNSIKLPVTLKFESKICPNTEKTTQEFACKELDVYSNNGFINFGQYKGEDFPELHIKFLSVIYD